MAFLDNSGDIILDAVLTDTGRYRLARGDGSFKIAKFALGDDEIDYANYQNSNYVDGAHTSGSAYYDLQILQTPVLEAFTNNTSNLQHKLMSIARTNLLFLPTIKINSKGGPSGGHGLYTSAPAKDQFIILCSQATEDTTNTSGDGGAGSASGVLFGSNPGSNLSDHIRLDQGLDTNKINYKAALDPDLFERQYIIEMDHRLGSLRSVNNVIAQPQFIDDDNVASYRIAQGSHPDFVSNTVGITGGTAPESDDAAPAIKGPRGTTLEFKIKASLELQRSNYLFDKFGKTVNFGSGSPLSSLNGKATVAIDSTIRVTGATTGYKVDIPVKFVKCTDCTTSE